MLREFFWIKTSFFVINQNRITLIKPIESFVTQVPIVALAFLFFTANFFVSMSRINQVLCLHDMYTKQCTYMLPDVDEIQK